MLLEHDEFYTTENTVNTELNNYSTAFNGKVIYCNCDDPNKSEFFKYFQRNFDRLHLKAVMSTFYGSNILAILTKNGIQTKILNTDGSFQQTAYLIKDCDIICSNPPFSIFRDFMNICHNSGKGYLILGPANAIASKDMFTKWKNSEMHLGTTVHGSGLKFDIPDDKEKPKNNPQCNWYTNLTPDDGKEYKYMQAVDDSPYKEENYQFFDFELDGKIEKILYVPHYKEIPKNYNGIMAVSRMSFLNRCNPRDFEVLDLHKKNYNDKTLNLVFFKNKQNNIQENKKRYMKKQVIKINESQLHQIIKESVNNVLKESEIDSLEYIIESVINGNWEQAEELISNLRYDKILDLQELAKEYGYEDDVNKAIRYAFSK